MILLYQLSSIWLVESLNDAVEDNPSTMGTKRRKGDINDAEESELTTTGRKLRNIILLLFCLLDDDVL